MSIDRQEAAAMAMAMASAMAARQADESKSKAARVMFLYSRAGFGERNVVAR